MKIQTHCYLWKQNDIQLFSSGSRCSFGLMSFHYKDTIWIRRKTHDHNHKHICFLNLLILNCMHYVNCMTVQSRILLFKHLVHDLQFLFFFLFKLVKLISIWIQLSLYTCAYFIVLGLPNGVYCQVQYKTGMIILCMIDGAVLNLTKEVIATTPSQSTLSPASLTSLPSPTGTLHYRMY